MYTSQTSDKMQLGEFVHFGPILHYGQTQNDDDESLFYALYNDNA